AAGLYGTRVAACTADATTFAMPPYLADLIVVGGKHVEPVTEDAAYAQSVFRWLRPYGGTAYLKTDEKKLRATVQDASLAGAQVRSAGDGAVLLVREGPLPGAADWTHEYADAANSGISQDDRVKTPLGLLWFGGPPNDEVLPRHGHGPSPQVAGGRLFIEGRNMLRSLDIYTGRLLWQRDLPNLGRFHDNTGHQPGAGEIGGNCASTEDSVYVVFGEVILRLDAATGRTMAQFDVDSAVKDERSHWGYVGVWKDRLIATATPVVPGESSGGNESSIAAALKPAPYSSASRRLVVMDRRTGKVAWQREAEYGFRHNNIAVGRDTVFCIDALSRAKQDTLKRRGIDLDGYRPRLVALDVATGKERWSTTEDVFGTFLNYSAEHDVLLQAGSAYRDRASDETKTGMAAYRGADGRVLWKELDRSYSGPCLLHGDSIIAQGPAYSLLTGKPKTRAHPLTGETLPWQFTRNYGCNTAIGSRHLLTFRSAAAGFYDLAGDGGTGNLGGFKSGCTSNLIVAGGLLNAPEYTRTCTCRYQNQTSLALIHDPEVEMWTFNALEWDGQPVQRAGINFGAPGDRRAADGTLWMDFPSRGGPSPDLPVELDGEKVEMFRRHSSAVQATGDGFDWVAASGVRGARRIAVTLTERPVSKPLRYTVRLHFAELDDRKPGQRVFAVRLQDKEVIASLDIAKEAGPGTTLVKQFEGIEVTDKLTVSLIPGRDDGSAEPVLCGLEIVAEK
ncbi:MAG: PQQ-binding-like beta-propeller repeat protein, partial [Planctomycetes bacterium]|nr:PQQ-binding-like beta-propeller repeat protein [Planctomycetota bacterium]